MPTGGQIDVDKVTQIPDRPCIGCWKTHARNSNAIHNQLRAAIGAAAIGVAPLDLIIAARCVYCPVNTCSICIVAICKACASESCIIAINCAVNTAEAGAVLLHFYCRGRATA